MVKTTNQYKVLMTYIIKFFNMVPFELKLDLNGI